jgi:hypothetical protein
VIDDFDKLSVTELRLRGMTSDKILAEQKRRGMSKEAIHGAWYPKPPTYDRIGSRRWRRLLVVGTYGGWFVLAVIMKLASTPDSSFPVIPFVPLANVVVVLVWFGRKTYLGREVLAGDFGLDERLIQNRNQAFRRAFQLFASFALIAWLLSLLAMWLQPSNQGLTNAVLLYMGAALLGTTLPTVIWAWREPDPLATTEESS